MPIKVYFCGEVVADLLEQIEGSGDIKLHLGGSLFHGATGAKRAVDRESLKDIGVGFLGPLSEDMLGERFFKVLTDMNIDTNCVKRVERNTTLAVVAIRPGKENGFVFYGRDTADQMTHIEDLPQTVGNAGDQKIFCFGSISTVLEPARFAWLEFAKRMRSDSLVYYDLNTRPSIAKNPVTYREIVLEWARTAHIVKASDADIGWAYPGMALKDVAKIWLDAGALMAVFTKGMHGSEAYTKKTMAAAESMDLIAPNTIGAGDNFNAGFAINLAKGGYGTPGSIAELGKEELAKVLSGACLTASFHLISNGAQVRQKAS
jgi:fructokinase